LCGVYKRTDGPVEGTLEMLVFFFICECRCDQRLRGKTERADNEGKRSEDERWARCSVDDEVVQGEEETQRNREIKGGKLLCVRLVARC
jgi:hypothetical protein